jgi:hypothetical protein
LAEHNNVLTTINVVPVPILLRRLFSADWLPAKRFTWGDKTAWLLAAEFHNSQQLQRQ